MKKNLIEVALMLSKYFLYGFFIQFIAFNALFGKSGEAQLNTPIHANLRHTSINQVFDIIKKESGFTFVYDAKDINSNRQVNIRQHNLKVQDILNLLTSKFNFSFKVIGNTITVKKKSSWGITPVNAHALRERLQFQVTGTVTDSVGNPLIGVTVQVKGTKAGTTTNAQGHFEIKAPKNATLVFSYVGYQNREVPVNGISSINITLSVSSSSLNELVVVGYGTQKKIDLTGAVDQVSGKRLEDRPIQNVSEGLQGLMANLNVYATSDGDAPGATKSINIRGYTGLGTSGSPLILVDGVPADINSINPNDIASITVLKDAAASAIYGSRAPYGVLLIKTKQGKAGQPLAVSLNTNFSFSQPIDVPRMLNSLQFANLYNEAFKNANRSPFFADSTIIRIKQYIKDPGNTPVTVRNPNNPVNWLSWNGSNANNDWFKVFLKRWSPSEQHDLSLSGGSKAISYYMGLGYNQKNGLYHFFHDFYNRYNMRANITAKVNKWMTLKLRTSYAQENYKSPYAGADIGYNWFHQIPRRFPTVPVKDPNGHYTSESYIPEIMNGGDNLDKKNDSWITGEITLTPLPGWTIDGNYSYNYYSEGSQSTQLPYTHYNANNQPVMTGTISQLWKTNNHAHYHTYNIFTSYERTIKGHYFKALVGYQQEYKSEEDLSGHNSNLYSPDLPSLSLTYGNNYSASDNLWAWATEGIFTRFNYNYKEKYLFEFNGRYDGSSLFPSSSRYSFFPSFSVGYNISKESFWQPWLKILSNFKLRASYGVLGDVSTLLQEKNYYPYQTTLNTVPPTNTNWEFSGGREPYVQVGGLTDQGISWAKPSMLDFGVDVGAFNNRLQGTFDWYRRKTTDLFGPAQAYPSVLGVNPPQKNNASIETKGFDLTVSWEDKIGKVSYNARFILSNYKGTVLSYPNPTGYLGTWYDGEQMGVIWGYRAVDLFQSQEEINKSASQTKISSNWYPGDVHYADLNHDGKVDWGSKTVDSSGDLAAIGNSTPEFNYGFSFGINWHGFDVNAFIQGVGKREFFTTSNYFWGIIGSEWQSSPLTTNLNRWTPKTPNGYFPRYYMSGEMSKNMQPSSRYLLNAAYLRMKNLQIGYTLPKQLTRRIHVTRLRIYCSVENLFTIAPGLNNKFQVDPELLIGSSKIYPIQRTFSIGLNLNLQ